jgi:histidinol-phosphatase
MLELADVADALTLPRFHARAERVERKPDRSPVTEADRVVEAALRARLAAARPDDAVLGEELGGGAGGPRDAGDPRRRWLLDPIDGTMHFVRGIPVWGTLLALEEDGEPVAGLMSAPALGRRWWGHRALGARRDDGPIGVSAVDDLGQALVALANLGTVVLGSRRDGLVALAAEAAWTSGYESFWGPALVAEGGLDVAVLPEQEPWDLAPARALVEAAGGRVAVLDFGARTGRLGAVYANAALHDRVLALLTATAGASAAAR